MAPLYTRPITSDRAHHLRGIAQDLYPGETHRATLCRRLLADTVATLAAVAQAFYQGDMQAAKAEIYRRPQ